MKQIHIDQEDERVKEFVRSLPLDPDGSVLNLGGKPVLRVLPLLDDHVDQQKLKAAILNRRDRSRELNEDWHAADHEVWNDKPEAGV